MVPADLEAEAADAGVDGVESEVAGGEVEFFVVGGVVGDVHLAVFSGYCSVFFEYYCCVVVEAGGSFFEEGGDEYYSCFSGYC